MEFYTAYNPGPVEPTPSGEMEEPVFKMKTNSKGVKELVKTDEKQDVYLIKQEYLEETKIENIIKRYTNGDVEALEKKKGQYLDTTKMPTTLAEWEQRRIDAEAEFEKLPLEVRKEYDYNSIEFYDSIVNGTANDRIDKAMSKTKETNAETPTQTIEEPKTYQPGGNLNG